MVLTLCEPSLGFAVSRTMKKCCITHWNWNHFITPICAALLLLNYFMLTDGQSSNLLILQQPADGYARQALIHQPVLVLLPPSSSSSSPVVVQATIVPLSNTSSNINSGLFGNTDIAASGNTVNFTDLGFMSPGKYR